MSLNTNHTATGVLDALLAAQEKCGYLNEASLNEVAKQFDIPVSSVYETASFYSMFRFVPSGTTVIQICESAPCHVAGAAKTIAAFEEALGIKMGETTPDGKYTLEFTPCIGQCQASPSVVINGEVHTHVTADRVPALIRFLHMREEA